MEIIGGHGIFGKIAFFKSNSAPATYILNQISAPAKVAYSIWRINANYNGPLVRLRRTNGDELDFYATGDSVDKNAILSWVGSGDGTVVLAHDQSGNGYNAVAGGNPTMLVKAGVWQNGFCKAYANTSALQIPSAAFNSISAIVISSIYQRMAGHPAPHNIGAVGNAYHYPWVDGTIYSGVGLTQRLSLNPGGITTNNLSKVITDVTNSTGLLKVLIDGVQVASAQGTFASPASRDFPGGQSYGEAITRELIVYETMTNSEVDLLIANQTLRKNGI